MATKATESVQERQQRVAAAQKAVETRQLSLRVAGERFDLPKSTIHRHVQGKSMKVGAGRPTALTKEEEKSVVRSCEELAQLGFGIDRITVGRVVRDYLQSQERDNPFKDGVPGKMWWLGFLKRWPSLSERKPHFPVTRAQASCPEVMNNYFKNLQVNCIHNTYGQGNDIQIYASYKLYRQNKIKTHEHCLATTYTS